MPRRRRRRRRILLSATTPLSVSCACLIRWAIKSRPSRCMAPPFLLVRGGRGGERERWRGIREREREREAEEREGGREGGRREGGWVGGREGGGRESSRG
jgi:hypothetical protein